MQFLQKIDNPTWLPSGSYAEAYLSNELPPLELCVSVYGFIYCDGHILFTHGEDDHAHDFELPGGHIELGETPEQAIARELVEETGVTPEAVSLVAINKTHTPNTPENYRYPSPTSYMLFYAGKVTQRAQTNELGLWLSVEEAKQNSWVKTEQGIFDALLAFIEK